MSTTRVRDVSVTRPRRYAFRLLAEERDSLGCAPDTLVLSGGVAANAELRRRSGGPRCGTQSRAACAGSRTLGWHTPPPLRLRLLEYSAA